MSPPRRPRSPDGPPAHARLLGAAAGCAMAAGFAYLALTDWEDEPQQWALLCAAVVLVVSCGATLVLRLMGFARADEILFPKPPPSGSGYRPRSTPWTRPGIVAALAAALLWGVLGFPTARRALIEGPITGWRAAAAGVCAGLLVVSLGILFWKRYRRLRGY